MRARLCVLLLLSCPLGAAHSAATPNPRAAVTMELIRQWVHGYYDSQAQADADFAADLPDDEQHRLMYQLFAPVDIPGLQGHVVFQQSSTDGSLDPQWITRLGLLQFFVDESTGTVRQRELSFKAPADFHNAHLKPDGLRNLTDADVTYDPGCDFYLLVNDQEDLVAGDMPPGTCRMLNQGTGSEMIADDRVEIGPNRYSFRGRWVDAKGNLMWGTASSELNHMLRRTDLSAGPPDYD